MRLPVIERGAPRRAASLAGAAALCLAAACHPLRRPDRHIPLSASVPRVISPTSATPVVPSGLNQPENLVYDSVADVYLVSNMGGGDTAHDDNGFISRLRPDGTMLDARWIAGGVNGATLDAPKGLAIHGDTLAVADLGSVHLFDRRTGAPLGSIALPGVVMNDVAFASDGSLWITDTGPSRASVPVDTSKDLDAVWQVTPDGRVRAVARGLALSRPDGLVLDGGDALVATFGANRIERVHARTEQGRANVVTLPAGRVDGLRRLPDGALVATSWDAQAVWRVVPGESPRALLTGVQSPAGVAVDTRRHRLAVTSMQKNAVYFAPLP